MITRPPKPLYVHFALNHRGYTHNLLQQREKVAGILDGCLNDVKKFADNLNLRLGVGYKGGKPFELILAGQTGSTVDDDNLKILRPAQGKVPAIYTMDSKQKSEIVEAWKLAADTMTMLQPGRNIVHYLVGATKADNLPMEGSNVELSALLVDHNRVLQTRFYDVKGNWICKTPLHPEISKHFTPPHAERISSKQVRDITGDELLSSYRPVQRTVWERVQDLPRLDL